MDREFALKINPLHQKQTNSTYGDVNANFATMYITGESVSARDRAKRVRARTLTLACVSDGRPSPGILRQMADFSDYAKEVFQGIKEVSASTREPARDPARLGGVSDSIARAPPHVTQESDRIGQRIKYLTDKYETLAPKFLEAPHETDKDLATYISNPLVEWHATFPQREGMETNFITVNTRPPSVDAALAKCIDAPPLHLLEPFAQSEEDMEMLSRYSDPTYCLRAFAEKEMEEAERELSARRERRRQRKDRGPSPGKGGRRQRGSIKGSRRRYSMMGLQLLNNDSSDIMMKSPDATLRSPSKVDGPVSLESDGKENYAVDGGEVLYTEMPQMAQPAALATPPPMQPAQPPAMSAIEAHRAGLAPVRSVARPPPPPSHLLAKLANHKREIPVLVPKSTSSPYALRSKPKFVEPNEHVLLARPPKNDVTKVYGARDGEASVPSHAQNLGGGKVMVPNPMAVLPSQGVPDAYFTPVAGAVGSPSPPPGSKARKTMVEQQALIAEQQKIIAQQQAFMKQQEQNQVVMQQQMQEQTQQQQKQAMMQMQMQQQQQQQQQAAIMQAQAQAQAQAPYAQPVQAAYSPSAAPAPPPSPGASGPPVTLDDTQQLVRASLNRARQTISRMTMGSPSSRQSVSPAGMPGVYSPQDPYAAAAHARASLARQSVMGPPQPAMFTHQAPPASCGRNTSEALSQLGGTARNQQA